MQVHEHIEKVEPERTCPVKHVLRAPHDDPLHEIFVQPGQNVPTSEHARRVGNRRENWQLDTFIET